MSSDKSVRMDRGIAGCAERCLPGSGRASVRPRDVSHVWRADSTSFSTLQYQPFCISISMVLCLQRSYRRGAIFDSAEFANSIRRFYETSYGLNSRVYARNSGGPTGQPSSVECPQLMSTDLDGFTCKMHLAVRTSGGAAQRITSSAWKKSVGGIVRPSFFAVLRLMTSWNVVGCSMGKSAGLAPFRILAT
jgi:hypothetical protein